MRGASSAAKRTKMLSSVAADSEKSRTRPPSRALLSKLAALLPEATVAGLVDYNPSGALILGTYRGTQLANARTAQEARFGVERAVPHRLRHRMHRRLPLLHQQRRRLRPGLWLQHLGPARHHARLHRPLHGRG